MIIPFGDYTPDLPALGSQGSAKNCIPHVKGYKSLESLSNYGSALDAYCRGAFSAMNSVGIVSTYFGNASKLYHLVGTTSTDISKVGGYATAADSYWEFAKFGNQVVATNFDDTMQVVTISSNPFADLTVSPPRARHLGVVGDFLVVGNTYDAVDGEVPTRVRWPGIDTITSWTVSASTQADYQDLQGNGGWVQSIVGLQERGFVFQERAIWGMTYVGSPVIFDFQILEDARGAFAPRSVIAVGGVIYFLADDGFYAFSGGTSVPIGVGKVDKTFLADLNDDYLFRVTAAAIPNDKVIMWSYPGSGSADGTPNKVLLYNWATQKWCFAEFDHELIFRAMSVGVTLDGLDALYPNLDTLPFSLDSKVWMGGKLQLAGFDTSHRLSYFTGTAMDATFETGEFQAIEGQRAEIIEAVPLVDGGTHTVQMGTRETQAATVSWGSASTENSSGVCPVRSNSRYHRVRVNNTGSFNDAQGVLIPDDKVSSVGSR
jgi:hypothetical protein